jgi:hypothetical protein
VTNDVEGDCDVVGDGDGDGDVVGDGDGDGDVVGDGDGDGDVVGDADADALCECRGCAGRSAAADVAISARAVEMMTTKNTRTFTAAHRPPVE